MPTNIISWNVNGMRAVLKKGFTEWFEEASPDILCVQESRVLPAELKDEDREPEGYSSYWMPAQKKGYSGVATFTKKKPLSVQNMGKDDFDVEGRVQVLEFKKFTLLNCYYPNSQQEGKRIDYKLKFCDSIKRLCNKLVKSGKNIVLCGDYNIAHTAIDLARPKGNENNPGYLPEEREAMTKFLKAGYVDTFRHFHPDETGHYTWWSYRANARANNVGWRIDYHCVNEGFLKEVKQSIILSDVHGSDHCPLLLTLK